MKRRNKYLMYSMLSLAFIVFSMFFYNKYFNFNGKPAIYHIYADKLDKNTVNSYPQKIVDELMDDPYYELNISVEPVKGKIKPVKLQKHDYSKDIAVYLEPTEKIQSNDKEIKDLAKKIIGEDEDVIKIAENVAKWTSENIKYDYDLFRDLYTMSYKSNDAIKTINSKSGTGSEYANVFIAVMRSVGIPTKFILGHKFGESNDFWAEIYVEEVGWIPVDPQLGKVGMNNRYIKLFEGKDFVDLDIELSDIKFAVEKLK